jgi:hypothetical protein
MKKAIIIGACNQATLNNTIKKLSKDYGTVLHVSGDDFPAVKEADYVYALASYREDTMSLLLVQYAHTLEKPMGFESTKVTRPRVLEQRISHWMLVGQFAQAIERLIDGALPDFKNAKRNDVVEPMQALHIRAKQMVKKYTQGMDEQQIERFEDDNGMLIAILNKMILLPNEQKAEMFLIIDEYIKGNIRLQHEAE